MENVRCLICNSEDNTKHITLQDRLRTTSENFTIVKCQCGFHYLNPRPQFNEIQQYYDNPRYDPHGKRSSLLNLLFLIARKYTFKMKKNTILKYVEQGSSILDYGSGDGFFSSYMHNNGFFVDSYDPIADNEIFKLDKKYDVVTFWHSLEHIHNIDEMMGDLVSCLHSKSYVFIAVPNINAFEKIYFKSNWAPYDVPRHLYHFDRFSLIKYFNKYSLEIVSEYSIFLDMIYNIILSSKGVGILSYLKFFYILPYMCLRYLFSPIYKKSTLFYVFKLRK